MSCKYYYFRIVSNIKSQFLKFYRIKFIDNKKIKTTLKTLANDYRKESGASQSLIGGDG